MSDPFDLLQELVEIPGPPGQEEAVAEAFASRAAELGYDPQMDAKGSVRIALGPPPYRIVVTAHLDEIAMMVREIDPHGGIEVGPLGGLWPFKLGEGPVQILAPDGPIDAVLGFGSIHTDDPASRAKRAAEGPVKWSHARVESYLSVRELTARGVRPGTRVVVHPMRRRLLRMGDLVAGHFLDDRADVVAMLLALEELKTNPVEGVLFAATVSEEVGGEGARWIAGEIRPEVLRRPGTRPRRARRAGGTHRAAHRLDDRRLRQHERRRRRPRGPRSARAGPESPVAGPLAWRLRRFVLRPTRAGGPPHYPRPRDAELAWLRDDAPRRDGGAGAADGRAPAGTVKR